jgi:hypothetical protein
MKLCFYWAQLLSISYFRRLIRWTTMYIHANRAVLVLISAFYFSSVASSARAHPRRIHVMFPIAMQYPTSRLSLQLTCNCYMDGLLEFQCSAWM